MNLLDQLREYDSQERTLGNYEGADILTAAIQRIESQSAENKRLINWLEKIKRNADTAINTESDSASTRQEPDVCPECHGTGKTVINKTFGVEDCPECNRA